MDAVWAALAETRAALAGLGIAPSSDATSGGAFRTAADPRTAAVRNLRTALGRIGALVRFEVSGEATWPFYRGELSKGAPRPPTGPLLPRLVELHGRDEALDRLLVAIERLAVALVYEADCQEYVDARNTSIALLYAAGAVIAVERDVVSLAKEPG